MTFVSLTLLVLLIALLCKLQHNWAIKKRVRDRLYKYCMEKTK